MLSVIIAMSPGREKQLSYCLFQLSQQNQALFEVIVADDGSDFGAEIAQQYAHLFIRLEYLWRPNDHNLSRSRNIGAGAALGEHLLFINSDVLLNPRAIRAYLSCLEQYPQATIWGYIGCRKAVTAPSLWYPEIRVNWLDFRFFPLNDQELWQHSDLSHCPYRLAGGHHFAMPTHIWQKIGPMNEGFVYWGEEDIEYALRGLLADVSMVFLGDAWAEHIHHDYNETFHLKASREKAFKNKHIKQLEAQLTQQKPAFISFTDEHKNLSNHIHTHYLTYQPEALNHELSRLKLN